jgi:hypothetical protein
MNISKHIKRISSALIVALIAGFTFTSCSTIFDYEGDCSFTYHVKFKYDKNMLYADAFSGNVSYVSLYAFDAETGLLVYTATQSGDALKAEDYTMPLEVTPGTYDLLAWCGSAVANNKVIVPEVEIGKTTIEEVDCVIDRQVTSEHTSCVLDNMGSLYHGKERVTLTDDEGKHISVVNLTKNTNKVNIILQHLSGIDVDPSLFTFRVEDNNGHMDYANNIISDSITYHPWSVRSGLAGVDANIRDTLTRATITSVSVAVAEFTVGRLMTDNEPMLSIYNVEENKRILSIPLVDYALLVKSADTEGRTMSDQDYLDRQDAYSMTFFLDEHGDWASARIIINSWLVVNHTVGLE